MKHKDYVYLCASLIAGFIITCLIVSKYFTADADMVNSAIAWTEINKHGLSVMLGWKPTIDNWYLAIYPVHFLIFFVFGGPSVFILKAIAVSQSILCGLISSLIARKITGNPESFLLIVFFAGMSFFAYNLGYVDHIFSHNSVNLYGLLCILIYLYRRDSIYATVVICLLSLLAAVSDPWYVVAYLLPFMIHSVYMKATGGHTGRNGWAQMALLAFTMGVFFSNIIQRWLLVPVAGFKLASFDVILSNINWYFHDHGRMINLFFVENDYLYIASSLIFVASALLIALRKANRYINVLLALSVLGVSSSFVLGEPVKMEYSARFLANLLYLIPLILIINSSGRERQIVSAALALSLSSSAWSHALHVENPRDKITLEMISFMEANNLNYGYGAYWAARANELTWRSGGEVTIRPYVTNRTTGQIEWRGKHSQAFDTWYAPYKGKAFIAITTDRETCPIVSVCLEGIKKQYGEPDETLKFKQFTFYVYNDFEKP